MPEGLKNAPATFNRMVSHVLRPIRDFAPSYFDDKFVYSCAAEGATDLGVHLGHFRIVCEAMRANKLYANLNFLSSLPGENRNDITITPLNHAIKPIDVLTMPCKPRHLKHVVE